jgi:hypothetical protein
MSKASYLAVFLSFGLMASAQADPPWARDGSDNDKKHEKREKNKKHKKDEARSHFIEDDRSVIQGYYVQNPSSLPPGLAKRGGNLPPGLAKRGGNLPPGLSRCQVITDEDHRHMLPLPKELELRLPPLPHEVMRQIIGRDIVMINKLNNKILDVLYDALPHRK